MFVINVNIRYHLICLAFIHFFDQNLKSIYLSDGRTGATFIYENMIKEETQILYLFKGAYTLQDLEHMTEYEIIYNIIVRENENKNFYNVDITGDTIVISIVVNDFNKITMYKDLAKQKLKQFKYKNFKVV